jgi:hypothetical protein
LSRHIYDISVTEEEKRNTHVEPQQAVTDGLEQISSHHTDRCGPVDGRFRLERCEGADWTISAIDILGKGHTGIATAVGNKDAGGDDDTLGV